MLELNFPGMQKTPKKTRAEQIDELMKCLQPGAELGVMIERQLQDLPARYVILLVMARRDYNLLAVQLIQYFAKRNMGGLYVTTNKSAVDLLGSLEKNGLDASGIFVVDTITRKSGYTESGSENVVYIDSPENLTELNTEIEGGIDRMGENKPHFFVLDSLSTLLVYNPDRFVEKFSHSLSGKLRSKRFQAIFTLASETRSETVNVLAQFCDKVIELQ